MRVKRYHLDVGAGSQYCLVDGLVAYMYSSIF